MGRRLPPRPPVLACPLRPRAGSSGLYRIQRLQSLSPPGSLCFIFIITFEDFLKFMLERECTQVRLPSRLPTELGAGRGARSHGPEVPTRAKMESQVLN